VDDACISTSLCTVYIYPLQNFSVLSTTCPLFYQTVTPPAASVLLFMRISQRLHWIERIARPRIQSNLRCDAWRNSSAREAASMRSHKLAAQRITAHCFLPCFDNSFFSFFALCDQLIRPRIWLCIKANRIIVEWHWYFMTGRIPLLRDFASPCDSSCENVE
jgi:hypothetical protein